jgi:hypothetical protein
MPGAFFKAGRPAADGGPSLTGNWGDINKESHVAAVNGSLGFLLDNGVVPPFCAVMDAGEQLTNPSVGGALSQARTTWMWPNPWRLGMVIARVKPRRPEPDLVDDVEAAIELVVVVASNFEVRGFPNSKL